MLASAARERFGSACGSNHLEVPAPSGRAVRAVHCSGASTLRSMARHTGTDSSCRGWGAPLQIANSRPFCGQRTTVMRSACRGGACQNPDLEVEVVTIQLLAHAKTQPGTRVSIFADPA